MNFSFIFFLYVYIICGVTYGIHSLNYTDELAVVWICIYYFNKVINRKLRVGTPLLIYLFLLLFYVVYSFCLNIAPAEAILQDAIQESKPYLLFLTLYDLKITVKQKQKYILNRISIIVIFISSFIWAFLSTQTAYKLLLHPGYYGNIIFVSSLLFLYTSHQSKKSFFLFFIFITIGLICGRSKYYGEYVAAIALLLSSNYKLTFSVKNIVQVLVLMGLAIAVSWEKFYSYFLSNNEEAARTILYVTSLRIFTDYFPLGVGLGAYANDASKVYYSEVYDMYDISNIWGLSRDFDRFIADTYYPVIIGQFGAIGVCFFVIFWGWIIKNMNILFYSKSNIDYKICLLIIIAIIIESVAGPMLVSSIGLSYIILLSIIISENKKKIQNENYTYRI